MPAKERSIEIIMETLSDTFSIKHYLSTQTPILLAQILQHSGLKNNFQEISTSEMLQMNHEYLMLLATEIFNQLNNSDLAVFLQLLDEEKFRQCIKSSIIEKVEQHIKNNHKKYLENYCLKKYPDLIILNSNKYQLWMAGLGVTAAIIAQYMLPVFFERALVSSANTIGGYTGKFVTNNKETISNSLPLFGFMAMQSYRNSKTTSQALKSFLCNGIVSVFISLVGVFNSMLLCLLLFTCNLFGKLMSANRQESRLVPN